MLLLTYLFLMLKIYDYGRIVAEMACDDCVPYKNCEGAVIESRRRNSETQSLFQKNLCGFDKDSSGNKIPKVCCSGFPTPTPSTATPDSELKLALLPETCGEIHEYRLLGGRRAELYELPWMVLIAYSTAAGLQFKCGGSIINSRYVLTAAHCVQNKIIAGVRVGEYDISTDTDCYGTSPYYVCESHHQDIQIEEEIIHANYTSVGSMLTNDIALLRLKKPVDFNHRNVAPICLPTTPELRNSVIYGDRALVAGWGVTETDKDSSILLKVNIPVLSDSECRKKYNSQFFPAETDKVKIELCAGEINKYSCTGDSGGPLIIEKAHKDSFRYVQYGLVSRGPRECGSNQPEIYTDVSKHMDWILEKIKP